MRYIFYVNPTAGKGDMQSKIITTIKNHFANLKADWRIHITKARGDAEVSARKEAQKGDQVRMFACGGEGTMFEVLNGIVGFDNVELGVIPCGSANDFLKFFDSRSPFLDIEDQLDGNAIALDLIKAGNRYCLNGCSVGMDAMVASGMSAFKRWPLVSGSLAYKLAILKVFFGRLGISADISIDDAPPQKTDCLFAVVANAPYYGGGYKGAPDAVPFDEKLDFTLVDIISRLKILKFLPMYEKGTHKSLDCCTLKRCNSMEFKSEKSIPVNLDGEIVETDKMRFEIVKKAVNFVVPKTLCEKLLINV